MLFLFWLVPSHSNTIKCSSLVFLSPYPVQFFFLSFQTVWKMPHLVILQANILGLLLQFLFYFEKCTVAMDSISSFRKSQDHIFSKCQGKDDTVYIYSSKQKTEVPGPNVNKEHVCDFLWKRFVREFFLWKVCYRWTPLHLLSQKFTLHRFSRTQGSCFSKESLYIFGFLFTMVLLKMWGSKTVFF